jgi:phosphomannomutase
MKNDYKVFRAYDVRGKVEPRVIDTDLAYKLGYCFTLMNIKDDEKNICVARDCRVSSLSLFESLCAGIIDAGGIPLSLGITPTPALYFADIQLKPAGGIMITGSHNPKHDNGFKLVSRGKSFFGEDIQSLKQNIENFKAVTTRSYQHDSIRDISNLIELYISALQPLNPINTDLKICWDLSNGAACEIVKKLCVTLPNHNILINSDMDGNFPNHDPDPTVEANLEQLLEQIKTRNYHFISI